MNNAFLAEAAIEGAALAFANRKKIYKAGQTVYNMAKQYFPTRQSLMADKFRYNKIKATRNTFFNKLANVSGAARLQSLRNQYNANKTNWTLPQSRRKLIAANRARRAPYKAAYKRKALISTARTLGKWFRK